MEYAELAELAKRFGLRCSAARNYTLADDYGFLPHLARGENRYAFNILSGSYRQSEVLVFDYHYETPGQDPKSEDGKSHHFLTPILVLVPAYFPELRIAPEGALEKMAEAFGGEDIKFESAEFSRAFRVRSKDKRLAYDVCNARVMEYLLENRDLDILIKNCALALVAEAPLSAQQIAGNLERLVEFRLRLPEYLFTKNT
jgi:hypothetical protein